MNTEFNDILEFIEIIKNKTKEEFIGAIIYGSYINGNYNNQSDIDIIIVFQKLSNEIKGYKKYKNLKFEYYIRSLRSLYKRVENEFKNNCDSALAIIGKGRILIDKNNYLEELSKYTRNMYKIYWPNEMNKNDIKYALIDINDSLNKCMRIKNTNYFSVYYALTLEKIRKLYTEALGFSKISTSKVYEMYKNPELSYIQNRKLPDKKFIKLYLECIDKISQENLNKLFFYINEVLDFDINYEEIEINLIGKEF